MTDNQPDEDFFGNGIEPWALRVRSGELSFRQTTEACLLRTRHSAQLDAFECLDANRALATASALDYLLEQGTDLGPLMGLPIGIKDIMVVEGLPTRHGSNADLADLSGVQGQVVSRLRRAGAITLGKTRTVEFALGATGVNTSRGTPWNAADRQVQRIPGGSSSGSAVATAAGLVGMALGSDTGGSIRNPACLNGIVGYKTSVGLWPTDGVFSLSTTLDSIGPLTRTVDDAVLMHQIMCGEQVAVRSSVKGLRLGIVEDVFFDDLDDKVADDFERTCQLLEQQGAQRVALRFPELHERSVLFSSIVPSELINYLTPERFNSFRQNVDPVTESRAAVGLSTPAYTYVNALQRRQELIRKSLATFEQVDAWLSPACGFTAMPVADLATPAVNERALTASRNAQLGNLLDMCALSMPMHTEGLPTGLQLMMPLNKDAQLLAIAAVIESTLSG